MKKVLMSAMVIATMTMVTSRALAQQGFNLSVKSTPQFSFLQNSDDNDNSAIKKKATFNNSFGLGGGYNFTDNAGVGLDVLYSLQGQKYEVSGADVHQKIDYLKVPVYFSYNSDASQTVSFFGKIGPQISFLTDAKIAESKDASFVKNKDRYKDVTFGGMANAGVQFRLSPNVFLQTGLLFDYDFTNAEDKDFVSYTPGRASTHNMTAGVQVGLKYTW